jgi:primosomal protein N' (replication factor Y)
MSSPAIKLASQADMEGFYEWELFSRQMLDFPPFSRIFRVVFRGKNKRRTEQCIDKFRAMLRGEGERYAELLGPAECPLSVISGNYRFQLIARATSFSDFHRVLTTTSAGFTLPQGVYIEIDVDPVSLL